MGLQLPWATAAASGLRLVTRYSSAEVIELAALDLWVFRVGAFETNLVDGAAVGRLLDPLGRPLDTQVAYRVSVEPVQPLVADPV